MNFVDEAEIEIFSGKGGDGCVSFRREKYRPMGGPDGGDGGRGGSLILVADPELTTLLDHRYNKTYRARSGAPGMGSDRYGAAADDLIVRVPVGTVVHDAEGGGVLADLSEPGARLEAARGGKGGRGNMHFATSINQAPRRAESGEPGERRRLRLELKLLADVGVIGYPNTGKSTLVARLSRARPKIADYPFTTLVPTLGVVAYPDGGSFVLADVPGLIEGAADGAGLGHRFLRHVERCRALVHLVTWEPGEEPAAEHLLHRLAILDRELLRFDPALAAKPRLVVVSKLDLPEVRGVCQALQQSVEARGERFLALSAVSGEGLPELLGAVRQLLRPPAAAPEPSTISSS